MIIDNATQDFSVKHPIEEIEPIEISMAYRESSVFFFMILESSLAHILACSNIRIGVAQVKASLGLSGESLTDTANRLGVTPACISKGAKAFIKENNLPTPRGLQDEHSSEAKRQGRAKQILNKQK